MKGSGELVWRVLASTAVFCLLVLTAIAAKREFLDFRPTPTQAPPAVPARQPPVAVSDWARVASVGHRIGPADAPVTIVVFSDYECPFCALFATEALPALRERYPREIAILYRHWPLIDHPNAYSAAKASECAAAQGRFEAYHDVLFAQRDSLGRKSYEAFAVEAGVEDLTRFRVCMAQSDPLPAIERDVSEARRVGGTGTPTIVVAGMRLRPPYSIPAIATQVETALGEAER